jgi:uncharacterized protein
MLKKKLKLSKMCLFIPYDKGNYVLYHTLNGGIAIIDEEVKKFLELHDESGFSIDELKEPQVKEVMINLLDSGFLIDKEINESALYRYFLNRNRFDHFHAAFLVLTTYNCNLACKYCYQGLQKKNTIMTLSMAELVSKWMCKLLEFRNSRSIGIVFYGGEPLLNVKALKFINNHMLNWTMLTGRQLFIGLISNGVLLTKQLAHELVDKYGLKQVHITFDGAKLYHDTKRCFPDGRGTFDIILSNLLSYVDSIATTVRVNIDKYNIQSIPELLDIFQHYGLKDKIRIYFARVYAWGPEAALVRPVTLPEEEFEERAVKLYELAARKGFNIALDLVPVLCDVFLDNHFIVDPDGKIFKCWDLIGNEEFVVGDISRVAQKDDFHPEDDIFLPNYYEILGIDPTQDEKCRACSFLPLCHGGCRAKSFKLYNNIHAPYCAIEALKKREELIKFWVKFKYKELLNSLGQDKYEAGN